MSAFNEARKLPVNVQAEQALLGAILANNKAAYARVRDFLKPEHFADPVHSKIYEAMARRIDRGELADVITFKAEFENSGTLAEVGGISYLVQLLSAMVGIINAGEYGRAILDCWQRRQLIELAAAISEGAYDGIEAQTSITDAMASIEALASSNITTTNRSKTLTDAIEGALNQADAVARGEMASGIKTGMQAVDEAVGGFEDSDLIILGGRPGSGKSSLAWQWAVNLARVMKTAAESAPNEKPGAVLAISMEMTAEALGRRALSTVSGVPIWKMKKGMHAEHATELIAARRELLHLPIFIEDGGRASAADMMAMARKVQKTHRLRLVLIDHLQIAQVDEQDNRNGSTAGVAGVAHAMKEMAKRLGCPVILLSQLNRALENRDDHRPMMSDLRQAGAIEEDADMVLFVHRAETFLAKSPPDKREGESEEKHASRINDYHIIKSQLHGKAELILAKMREGETTSVALLFDGPTASFRTPIGDQT